MKNICILEHVSSGNMSYVQKKTGLRQAFLLHVIMYMGQVKDNEAKVYDQMVVDIEK